MWWPALWPTFWEPAPIFDLTMRSLVKAYNLGEGVQSLTSTRLDLHMHSPVWAYTLGQIYVSTFWKPTEARPTLTCAFDKLLWAL